VYHPTAQHIYIHVYFVFIYRYIYPEIYFIWIVSYGLPPYLYPYDKGPIQWARAPCFFSFFFPKLDEVCPIFMSDFHVCFDVRERENAPEVLAVRMWCSQAEYQSTYVFLCLQISMPSLTFQL